MNVVLLRTVRLLVGISAPLILCAQTRPAPDPEHPQNTARAIYLFAERCARCHDNSGSAAAPDRYTLNSRTPEQILAVLTSGSMAQYAKGLTDLEVRYIAVYLGGRPLGADAVGDINAMKNACPAKPLGGPEKAGEWNGWAPDPGNSRFQPNPGISAADVPRLKLKWAFGFPQGNSAYGQPSVFGGRVSGQGWCSHSHNRRSCP
jgi:polyvinyl alcohol dehydrogenase (cytochrome)